jgi:hypothetical protein
VGPDITVGAAHLLRKRAYRASGETMTTFWGAVLSRRTLTLALPAILLLGVARADGHEKGDDEGGGAILVFHTMATVQGALVGTRNPFLRNQAAGGLPWVITKGHGTLLSDGKLHVTVHGLVLANDPAVPAALRLTNPVPTFRAVVSCVTRDGTAVTSETPAVSASSDGDAHIEAFVDPPLPNPCVAPIVFVGNGAGMQQNVSWFAATGVN